MDRFDQSIIGLQARVVATMTARLSGYFNRLLHSIFAC